MGPHAASVMCVCVLKHPRAALYADTHLVTHTQSFDGVGCGVSLCDRDPLAAGGVEGRDPAGVTAARAGKTLLWCSKFTGRKAAAAAAARETHSLCHDECAVLGWKKKKKDKKNKISSV